MRYIENIIEWFRSLSTAIKVVVILVVVLVAILASRAVSTLAALVVVIGIIALIVQAVRRRPLRQWGILTLGALVVAVVFGSVANALYGPTETRQESAVSPAPAEEAKQEQPEPPPPAPPPEPASEEKSETKSQRAERKKKEQPEEATVEIGQSVEVDEATWLVTDARRAQQLDDQFGGILPPKQGNFVIVDFRFKNNSNETKTLHSGALKLIDRDGRESEPDTDTFSYIPQDKNILLEQVNPGVTKDAQVIFSVAPEATGFKLRLRGTSLFSLEEPKEVDLGF